MKKPLVLAVLLACAVPLAGCGILFPNSKMAATKKTPGFKAGYADGCSAATAASANVREGQYRNEAMYKSDKDYRMGWANGYHGCRPTNNRDLNDPSTPLPIQNMQPGAQSY